MGTNFFKTEVLQNEYLTASPFNQTSKPKRVAQAEELQIKFVDSPQF